MKKNWLVLAAVLISGYAFQGCIKEYDYDFSIKDGINRYDINWAAAADSSTGFLIKNFWNGSAGYFNKSNVDQGFNYWPQAHGLDVLTDAYLRTQKAEYKDMFDKWFDGVNKKNGNSFLNHFYDDMEWNGLAILRVYDATNADKYKTAVGNIWTDIKTGWNDNQGGGISWNKSTPDYKNTPANAPASILAARLYQRFKNEDDLVWAKKIYEWLKSTLYDPSTGFVYDGINSQGDGKRDDWPLTYNQGTMIGAALELYHITKEKSYLNDAMRIADNTLTSASLTTADRLLRDEGQGDGGLFKGIFIRYFTELIQEPDLEEAVRKRYVAFFKLNAETLWYVGANKELGLYGTYWRTPAGTTTDLTTEESGAMLMEAAALLHSKTLL
ncbi:MAG TPA: glycoside hydrolase family 76 protein [Arachidicoccus sp.]|nr:glycoside hydrolase family 76 protein [Arachidicoccus sp.]